MGFWGVVAPLFLIRSWKIAYYRKLDQINGKLYLFWATMGILCPFMGLMGVPTSWSPTRLRNWLCYMQFTRNEMLFPLHLSLKNVKIMSSVDTEMRIADGRFGCMG
ncbi:hypothetical protein Gotur_010399 [Gossypium turneri]